MENKKYLALVEVEAGPITAQEYYAEWQGIDGYNFNLPKDSDKKGYILFPTTELMKLDTCDCHFWKSNDEFSKNCVPLDGTMPFEFALAMAKRGHKLQRKVWQKLGLNAYVAIENGEPVMHLLKSGKTIKWTPLQVDIMGNDWIITKD